MAATATSTLVQYSALLKEVYEQRIPSQLYENMKLTKRIKSTSDGVTETTGGKYVDFPIEIGRNEGVSYRLEGEQLGDAGSSRYVPVQIPLYYGYGRGRFTGQLFELADKNPRAFVAAADRDMKSLRMTLQRDSTRILYGDGNGLLAAISAGSGAVNTMQVLANNVGAYWLAIGQQVDVLNRTTFAAVFTARQITAINRGTGVVTFDGAANATATTDGIYRAGNKVAGVQKEPTGLAKIVAATGALHNVDPATVSEWAASATAVGGALTEEAMILKCDQSVANGGEISAIFTSQGVRRAYFGILKTYRQFVNTQTFDGGFTGLPFNYGKEIPVIDDPDCPASTMYFLDESQFSIRHTQDWHFDDRDGSIFKWRHDFDQWDVMMKRYWEFATYKRNAHGVLTTVTEA